MEEIKQYLLDHVRKEPGPLGDDCWIWTASLSHGYGQTYCQRHGRMRPNEDFTPSSNTLRALAVQRIRSPMASMSAPMAVMRSTGPPLACLSTTHRSANGQIGSWQR